MPSRPQIALLDPLFTTDPMRKIFSDGQRIQAMLDFEAALARALVRTQVAPAAILPAIETCRDAAKFDLEALAREAALAGNLAIPLVKALTALVERADPMAARFVHWGATSQDAMDTGLVLQMRAALEWVGKELGRLSAVLARTAEKHKSTIMPGRTWLQQAPPVTFGLVAAGWLSATERHRSRLREAQARALVVQFGGAVGTLAALEDRGLDVAQALARELELGLPDVPWHSHRDRVAEVATTLALLVGTLGKIARDLALMAQTETGEASEAAAPGQGGSSTMPHKRNPVGAAVVLAAAIRVPALVSVMLAALVQEHERGLGGWHAEWETLPEIFLLTAGALSHTLRVLDGLEVHERRMAGNLEVTRGLILSEAVAVALGKHMGRSEAHALLDAACRRAVEEDRHLRDVLTEDQKVRAYLSPEEIVRLMDPTNYLGVSAALVERVLSGYGGKP